MEKTNCVTIAQTKQPWTRQQENLQNDDHNNVVIRQISFQLLEKEQEEWHVSALNCSPVNIRITNLETTQSILVFFFIVSERYHFQKQDQLWNDRVTWLIIRQLKNFLWNCCLAKPSHLSWMEEPIWHLRSWTPSEFPERDAENVLTIKNMKTIKIKLRKKIKSCAYASCSLLNPNKDVVVEKWEIFTFRLHEEMFFKEMIY